MGDKKNIDRLFQEQFRDFEATPDEAVWDKISQRLDENQKTKKKKIMPFWFKVSGIAAGLILLISLGVNALSTLSTNNNGVVNTTNDNKSNQSLNLDTNSAVANTNESQSKAGGVERNSSSDQNKNLRNNTNITSDTNESQNNSLDNELNKSNDGQGDVLVERGQNKTETGKGQNNGVVNPSNKNRLASQGEFENGGVKPNNSNPQRQQDRGVVVQDNKTNQTPRKLELQPSELEKDVVLTNNKNEKEVVAVNEQVEKKIISQLNERNTSLEKTSQEVIAAQDTNETLFNKIPSGNDKEVSGINQNKDGIKNEGEKQQIEIEKPLVNSIDKRLVEATVNNKNNDGVVERANKEEEGVLEVTKKQGEKESDATRLDEKNDLETSASELKALAQEEAKKEQTKEGNTKDVSESVANVEEEEKKKEELLKEDDKKSIEEAIAEQETTKEVEEEIDEALGKKWNVAPSIAPVYYNTLSQGSPIDDQFKTNPKKAQVSMSYGLHFSYDIGKRWSVRSGVQKLEVGYKTEQVAVLALGETSGVTSSKPRNVELAPQAEGLDIISSANVVAVQMPANFSSLLNSNLEQRLGYLEVPLELTYKVTQSRFSIRIIGGMSTFILNDNEIYANWLNEKRYVGKAANVNQVSFSTNLGLGASYDLGKSFYFNLEPTFKYQLNPFSSDSGNFKPYILGVYSGFSFKF